MSSRAAPHWIARCRRVCLRWCRGNRADLMLGGPGRIVEIDEMKLGHRKYHRGCTIDGTWLFGAYERGTGRLFIVPVTDRSVKTLLPLIKRHIAPRTTVVSDCWRGYAPLRQDPDYRYLSVNHSKNFVNPATGAHTQHIERIWRDVRDSLPRYGCSRRNMMEYLAEYMFRREVPLSRRIETFFRAIAETGGGGGGDAEEDDDTATMGVFSHHSTAMEEDEKEGNKSSDIDDDNDDEARRRRNDLDYDGSGGDADISS